MVDAVFWNLGLLLLSLVAGSIDIVCKGLVSYTVQILKEYNTKNHTKKKARLS